LKDRFYLTRTSRIPALTTLILPVAGIPNLTADPYGQNGLNRYESMQEDTKGKNYGMKTKAFEVIR
jgi:hypothetical protein